MQHGRLRGPNLFNSAAFRCSAETVRRLDSENTVIVISWLAPGLHTSLLLLDTTASHATFQQALAQRPPNHLSAYLLVPVTY